MKCVTIRNLLTVPTLDGYHWEFDIERAILHLSNEGKGLHLEFALMDYGVPTFNGMAERYKWCHEWLVDYLRDVMGPPVTSNLAEIDSSTWVGWQAVTSLGNGQFNGTRCIVSNSMPLAARISFPIRRDPLVSELAEILENVSFEEKADTRDTP
jgi:hypothetical protein